MRHKKSHIYKKVIDMKEFLEKILRQNVIMTENKEVYKKLPLVYRGRYDIFTVENTHIKQKYLLSFLFSYLLSEQIFESLDFLTHAQSASRCFDELEYLNIDVLGMKGKSRVINSHQKHFLRQK